MGRARAVATMGIAIVALVRCTLLVDTDGLSGGSDANPDGSPDATSDAPPPDASSADASTPLGATWLAYGASTIGVRAWNASVWGPELPGPTLPAGRTVKWILPRDTQFGSMLAVVSAPASGAGTLDVFERDSNGGWHSGFSVPAPDPRRRGFDIEIESSSGAVVVVYSDGTPAPKTRRRTASGWSSETTVQGFGSQAIEWVELARNPTSDQMMLVAHDEGANLAAWLYEPPKWGNPDFLEGNMATEDFKDFDVTYDGTGAILAVWGNVDTTGDAGSAGNMMWALRAPGAMSFSKSVVEISSEPIGPLELAREPGSNRIAFAALEHTCNQRGLPCDDFVMGVWTGSSWNPLAPLDLNTTTLYEDRPGSVPVSVAWLGNTGVAIGAYHRTLSGNDGALAFARFSGGALGDVTPAQTKPLGARASIALAGVDGPMVLALVLDVDGNLFCKGYRESGGVGAWSDVDQGTPLATNLPIIALPFAMTTAAP
jgi:hypothetical protein